MSAGRFVLPSRLFPGARGVVPGAALALGLMLSALTSSALAQNDPFDASWYAPNQPYLKIAVVEDGVYRVTGQDLAAAGAPLTAIDPATFRLFENGREIPLQYAGDAGVMGASDYLAFVGRRNRGDDEVWAYNYDASLQSSDFLSLYTDTTYYWLTWNAAPGRRFATPEPPANPVPLTAVRDTLHLETDDSRYYFFGDTFFTGNPLYTRGEGFYWDRFTHNNTNGITKTYEVTLETPTRAPGDTLTVRVKLNGETNSRHKVAMRLRTLVDGVGTFVPVDTVEWSGTAFATLEAALPQELIPGNLMPSVELTSFNNFTGSPVNRVFLDWIEVVYTRTLTAVDDRLTFTVAEGGAFAFDLTGFTGGDVWVYAPERAALFALTASGGTASFADAPEAGTTYHAVGETGFRTPARLTLDAPSDWANPANAADYVILTTAALRASAEDLAAYRASPDGGGHTVVIADVQDVFDQFDYGRPTPIAIRRFVRATGQWATVPRFLFIWGDALYPDPNRPRHAWEVPSFGHSASDGWFAMQNGGLNDYTESLAIGRLPIRNNDSGRLFAEKIAHYESRPFDRWQKRAMFLVGGVSAPEKTTLQSFALDWSDLVNGPPAALDTLHFFKNASAPLDPTFKDSLQTAFENGASWLAYFGHSAAQTWEIVTEPPRDFANADRLPVVLSLGCFTGDFATGSGDPDDPLTFSEQLVLESLNGSIAHWGASASGTILASAQLSDEIHEKVFTDTLRTLGVFFQEAKRAYSLSNQNPLAVKHTLQYGLIGDPATRLSLPTRPDFTLTPAQITVAPAAPIPADSALTVTVRALNLGLVPTDSVTLYLDHTAPDGRTTRYERRLPAFGLAYEAVFTVPIDDESAGEHRLQAILDPLDAFTEEDELNNAAERTQIVFSTGLTLAAPLDFGLVDTTTPTLRTSLANPAPAPVVFQIDTVATFDSPARIEHRTAPAFLSAEWRTDPLTDGETYFWRARIDDGGQVENWKEGVFTVDTALGKRGWMQRGSLFGSNEQSSFLEYAGDAWRFKTFTTEVSASGSREGVAEIHKGQFVVNGEIYERLGLGFGMLILDGGTGEVKAHGSTPTYANNFEDPVEAFAELRSLAALVEPGDYVLVRTRHKGNFTNEIVIPDSVKAVFRDLGSTAIDTLTYKHLWIMFTRAGMPETTLEWAIPPGVNEHEIIRTFEIPFHFSEGQTLTPPIGPAKSWTALGWSASLPNADSYVRVEVLSGNGAEVLVGDLTAPGEVDLSTLDASAHPFLRLRATLADPSARATPQLTQWYVAYEDVPELALDPSALTLSADTLLEGEPLTVTALARNLGPTPAETALLEAFVTDGANETTLVHTDTLRNLTGEATVTFTLETPGLVGENRLQLTLRQPGLREGTVFNNVLLRTFVVRRDATPPTFEVMIDGETFPNDPNPVVNLQDPALPFVSAQPAIEILIEDDNPFLALKGDTTVVTVTLDDARIPFDVLAGGKKAGNELRLRFTPDFTGSDSTHTLVVRVADASGNEAEGSPYQVHFRTASRLLVEKVYPYPNPMNRFTVFAFRLIGADASQIEDFRLRIYTITGRLIREFNLVRNPSLTEAGGLRIGWNKVRWDGRDTDGDRVATGVYLYKVLVRARDADADFNQATDVEKLVVIR
ncbi:C25 family cysteine peptidase [Rhodocaloribacter sp.]